MKTDVNDDAARKEALLKITIQECNDDCDNDQDVELYRKGHSCDSENGKAIAWHGEKLCKSCYDKIDTSDIDDILVGWDSANKWLDQDKW